MNKISKEDLENLFNQKNERETSDNLEKISVHKSSREKNDEMVLRNVRKKIKKVKIEKNTPTYNSWESILRFIAVSGFTGFIIFVLLNFPAYLNQVKWLYFVDYLGENLPNVNINLSSPTATPNDKLTLPNLQMYSKDKSENLLLIGKINVSSPIIYDVEESDIIEKLKDGVAHYKGTATPGKGGNIFIVGHSSNYFWVKSDYNQVFSLLDKLNVGDRIEIKKDGKSYYYDVFQTKEISPEDVDVLQSSTKEILTLMTCWPVGTSLNRLIVQAELAYSAN